MTFILVLFILLFVVYYLRKDFLRKQIGQDLSCLSDRELECFQKTYLVYSRPAFDFGSLRVDFELYKEAERIEEFIASRKRYECF